MRLGSPSSAARHRYTQRVLNSVHVPLRVPFVSVLPPRRLLHVKFKTRHVVFQPTAAQRTAVAADEVPGPNEGFPSEYFGNTRPSQPRRAALASALGVLPSPLDKLENAVKILNTMTNLLGVIALLILLPAWLACKCIPARAWQAAALYYVSFGFGVLQRALKYGKAAGSSWKHDAHLSTWQGKRAITLFVLLVIAGHWAAIFWYGTCLQSGSLSDLHTLPGVQYIPAVLLPAALALHVWATETLSKACDHLGVPIKLVRSGPYAWCQHPIYTSYTLLFSGLMLWFGEDSCLLMLYVCWRYFKRRIEAEAWLLQEAFGNEYIAYKAHTGSFFPKFF